MKKGTANKNLIEECFLSDAVNFLLGKISQENARFLSGIALHNGFNDNYNSNDGNFDDNDVSPRERMQLANKDNAKLPKK